MWTSVECKTAFEHGTGSCSPFRCARGKRRYDVRRPSPPQGVTIDTSAKRLVVKFTFEASADDKVSVAAGAIDPNLVQRVSVVNNRVQVVSLQPNADPSSVKAQLEQVAGVQGLAQPSSSHTPTPRRAVC